MPPMLILTFLIAKEAFCLQLETFKCKRYRQAAKAAQCAQPAARAAAAAGTDARRALDQWHYLSVLSRVPVRLCDGQIT